MQNKIQRIYSEIYAVAQAKEASSEAVTKGCANKPHKLSASTHKSMQQKALYTIITKGLLLPMPDALRISHKSVFNLSAWQRRGVTRYRKAQTEAKLQFQADWQAGRQGLWGVAWSV